MGKRIEKFVTCKTTEGEPITVGERTLTPQAQVLRVLWPGGGFVWNRPTGIGVESGDGTEFVAITDATRWVVLGLRALTALMLTVSLITGLRRTFVR